MTYRVLHSECVAAMREMPAESVDAIVTDPPYELGFMGKHWDASGIAYSVDMWREALRVLRPGGHLLAFGGTRTYHRMACAIEDAGFDLRDCILAWVYGQGFPKSLDVAKAIDGHLGADRETLGSAKGAGSSNTNSLGVFRPEYDVTAPASWAARQWDGWGTALKPSQEPVVVARKPLIGTVAANVLRHGTGGLNVEACRVGDAVETWPASRSYAPGQMQPGHDGDTQATGPAPAGRWPPNLLLTHSPECNGVCVPGCPVEEMDRQSGTLTSGEPCGIKAGGQLNTYGTFAGGIPVTGYGDTVGASRFFPVFRYVAKPARGERDAGLYDLDPATGGEATDREEGSDGLKSPRAGAGRNGGARNRHPTVKPIALMEWLVALVTPPGGTVLDPFLGSGTTGCAAVRLGFDFIGIEREADFVAIAERRIRLAANAPRSKGLGELERNDGALPGQIRLFGDAP